MNVNQPFTILGAGSWGTALALYLANQGQSVTLWTHDSAHADEMIHDNVNTRYLPNYPFPKHLRITSQLDDAVNHSHDLLIAVPSSAFRELLEKLKPLISDTTRVIWATKGLDPLTGHLLHEVAQEVLGKKRHYAILTGPSFASEVAAGLPTAIVIATEDPAFAHELMQRFNSRSFRTYLSHDVTGVEIGGIVKNVLAIAAGIIDGLHLGANARSALITRGLAEMIRLGLALGGQYETFTGLSGLGDLVLTCTDNQSRNRRFGLALARNKNMADAEREIGQVIEGKRNVELILALAHQQAVEMPITETVGQILQGKVSLPEAIQNLLSRAPKAE